MPGLHCLPACTKPAGFHLCQHKLKTIHTPARPPLLCVYAGEDIPDWFAFKSVVQVLRDHQQHKVGQ